MAIGDARFSRATMDFNTLLELHGVTITASRMVQSKVTSRDIFGTPQNYTPDTFTAKILVTDQYLDETAILAGGKPKEVIKIIASPGTFIENDEITYSSHTYQVTEVEGIVLGGSDSLELYTATRQVEV